MLELKLMTNNPIPHFWESLRWSIMLRFLSGSIFTWFIGTQIGVMIEYRQLQDGDFFLCFDNGETALLL